MAAYIALILLPSFFALLNPKRISLPAWVSVFLIYVFFVGLRYQVGPDWGQYIQLHELSADLDFNEITTLSEPLSYTLFWMSKKIGAHVYLTNIVAAIIMLTGVYKFAKCTVNPWIAVLAATPYFIIVVGMSGIRQAMAAGVILILLAKWKKISSLKHGGYIILASLFHTSALVNSLFLITRLRVKMFYKLFFGASILAITIYLGSFLSVFSANFNRYEQSYIAQEGVASLGSLFHIAMIAIPAALGIVFRRRLAPYILRPQLLTFGIYATIAVIAINFFSSTAASRLTIYLYFIPMIVYPAFSYILGRRNLIIATTAIALLHLVLLISWLQLANNAAAYLPYQNAIFQ